MDVYKWSENSDEKLDVYKWSEIRMKNRMKIGMFINGVKIWMFNFMFINGVKKWSEN